MGMSHTGDQLTHRFWKALNRKVSPSTKEPKGRIGEKVYAAESYLGESATALRFTYIVGLSRHCSGEQYS